MIAVRPTPSQGTVLFLLLIVAIYWTAALFGAWCVQRKRWMMINFGKSQLMATAK